MSEQEQTESPKWDLVMDFRNFEEAVERLREAHRFSDPSELEYQPGKRGRPDITIVRIRYAK